MTKHLTVKDRERYMDITFYVTLFFLISSGFSFILMDFNLSIILGIGSTSFGLLFVLALVSWKSQIGYELQCKIAGVNFNDFCTCKFHRKLKEEKEKGQSKLE